VVNPFEKISNYYGSKKTKRPQRQMTNAGENVVCGGALNVQYPLARCCHIILYYLLMSFHCSHTVSVKGSHHASVLPVRGSTLERSAIY